MITITDSAMRHFCEMISRSKGMWLKLSVRRTGCSGYAYALELVNDLSDDLVPHESNGITVHIPEKDQDILRGLELDYRRDGFFDNLVFNNPNAKSECGCGESFRP
jgi:iron-sulfur cluster assembly protein